MACAWASASIAAGRLMSHSWSSIVFVIACAKVGPEASCAASSAAASSTGSARRLKKPQRSASSAPIERPVNSSSAVRPWPIRRGSIAHTPMSQPARPTRVNRKATLARGVPRRMSAAVAIAAPAPTQTPSIAAITGCGQPRIAFTRSPVMRVKRSSPRMSISVSGPMMSRTSPPEQKLPSEPAITITLTSSS
jgi:hypothetical protein